MNSDFIRSFNHLIELLNDYVSSKPFYDLVEDAILEETPYWEMKYIDIDLKKFDEIIKIINKIEENDKEYLKEFKDVRLSFTNLLVHVLKNFQTEHNNRRGWRYRYPECYFDLYGIEIDLMDALEDLITYTKKPLIEMFELMTSDEKVGFTSVCRQLKVPYDMERHVSEYIGN